MVKRFFLLFTSAAREIKFLRPDIIFQYQFFAKIALRPRRKPDVFSLLVHIAVDISGVRFFADGPEMEHLKSQTVRKRRGAADPALKHGLALQVDISIAVTLAPDDRKALGKRRGICILQRQNDLTRLVDKAPGFRPVV